MDDPIRNRPRDLLVAGHINVDEFLAVDEFPLADRTVPVTARRAELGGTATTIASTAARYGVASGLVARLGRGFPPEFLARLRRGRVDLRGVEVVRTRTTPTCYIVEDRAGGQRTFIDQGAMADDLPPRFRLGPWLREYAWVHLTTGPPKAQLDLLARARRAGLRAAADPGQEVHYRWTSAALRSLAAGAEMFWGNRAEVDHAAELLGVASPLGLLGAVPLVVRTEGRSGATAFTRAGRIHVPAARPRRIRSVVGAGDAFRGGFYAGWFAGQPLEDCLRAGTHAAARHLEGRS